MKDAAIHDRFAPLDLETAPPAARPLLAASQQQLGFLPSPVARGAHSPQLLKHLLAGFGAFDRTSLSPVEREVIAFTVGFENGCHYCMALHTALLAGAAEHQGLVAALRAGQALADARLEALRRFVLTLLRERGRVTDEGWRDLTQAGFNDEQALEILLGVAVYWFSTVTNITLRAPLDPPLLDFAWRAPAT